MEAGLFYTMNTPWRTSRWHLQALGISRLSDKVRDLRSWAMGWCKKLFRGASDKPLDGAMYQVAKTLYSRDGKHSAEIRKLDNGQSGHCLTSGLSS